MVSAAMSRMESFGRRGRRGAAVEQSNAPAPPLLPEQESSPLLPLEQESLLLLPLLPLEQESLLLLLPLEQESLLLPSSPPPVDGSVDPLQALLDDVAPSVPVGSVPEQLQLVLSSALARASTTSSPTPMPSSIP